MSIRSSDIKARADAGQPTGGMEPTHGYSDPTINPDPIELMKKQPLDRSVILLATLFFSVLLLGCGEKQEESPAPAPPSNSADSPQKSAEGPAPEAVGSGSKY